MNILITGGTGSFGKCAVSKLIARHNITVFSRDELKQFEMAKQFPAVNYIIGDIRDKERLQQALTGIDCAIHAAALKQVPLAESNPVEAILTNIIGAINLVHACRSAGVRKIIALSTDKAVNPINLYGATKLCMEKLLLAHNSDTLRVSVTRYGNVMGSRGSVIPLFKEQAKQGTLTITHPDMTRFWITLDDAVDFVLSRLTDMWGGEIFVPKMRAMSIVDLAETIAPDCDISMTGIRPGEKLHEVLISKDDNVEIVDKGNYYIIRPDRPGIPFDYSSRNAVRLTAHEMRGLIDG